MLIKNSLQIGHLSSTLHIASLLILPCSCWYSPVLSVISALSFAVCLLLDFAIDLIMDHTHVQHEIARFLLIGFGIACPVCWCFNEKLFTLSCLWFPWCGCILWVKYTALIRIALDRAAFSTCITILLFALTSLMRWCWFSSFFVLKNKCIYFGDDTGIFSAVAQILLTG